MSIKATVSSDRSKATIAVVGAFDFSTHKDFRDACDSVAGAGRCEVDMESTTYMDSSALGMLLLLKERVPNVSIRNCSGYARRVLQLANFERLFDID